MIPATRLFVANLPANIKDEDLISAFSIFGKVTNLDLNVKTEAGKELTKFAFLSLSAPNADVQTCIQYFANEDFYGNKLYVSIARESFLEKLQREQVESQLKDEKFMCQESLNQKNLALRNSEFYTEKLKRSSKWSWRSCDHCYFMEKENAAKMTPIYLSETLNPRKRKIEYNPGFESELKTRKRKESKALHEGNKIKYIAGDNTNLAEKTKKVSFRNSQILKQEMTKKMLESMKKRQIYKEKPTTTTSLTKVDEIKNKRVKFPDLDDILKQLKENDKKVTKQITIHWIRVYQNARILHTHRQDPMHSHLSLTSILLK
ncbi:probable RNA-binding protein CG14230 isoform X2 [Trichoplusia ni]|uniref:Probable RNA-binding protein CG14230 isoform X2 n=1 Tax=Trichoplusia ni TaxID=7111 RepID=A0A7E5VMW7_TRINI|nr:probable RNA-binding protein CG14230 isoform X2 [Trichoplusia ni]